MTIYRLSLIAILVLGLFLFQPRVKSLLLPLTIRSNIDSKMFWQAREFSSIGQFRSELESLPKSIITDEYPSLLTFNYDQIITYNSDKMESIDVAINKMTWQNLSLENGFDNLKMNEVKVLKKGQDTWLVGIFDPESARSANGYYLENKLLSDQLWLDISVLKGI